MPKVHQTVHVHAGLVLISERDCQSQLFYFVVFKVRYFLLGVLVVFAQNHIIVLLEERKALVVYDRSV